MNYNPNDYINATTRVRALEVDMVNAAGFRKMIEAKSAQEAFKVLADSSLCQGSEPDDSEKAFSARLQEAFDTVEKIAPDTAVVRLFRRQYDGHNLKVAIKATRLGDDREYLFSRLGTLPAAEAVSDMENGASDRLGRVGEAAIAAREAFARTGDPQAVDITIDKGVLAAMLSDAEELGSDFVIGYVRAKIDIANIRAAIRLSRMGSDKAALTEAAAPGGLVDISELLEAYAKGASDVLDLVESSPYGDFLAPSLEAVRSGASLTDLDRLCDDYLVDMMRGAKLVSFGAEPIAAYLAAKEWEVKAARIIMTSKLAGVSEEGITRRMRSTFI